MNCALIPNLPTDARILAHFVIVDSLKLSSTSRRIILPQDPPRTPVFSPHDRTNWNGSAGQDCVSTSSSRQSASDGEYINKLGKFYPT
jgi:hypothetical protein